VLVVGQVAAYDDQVHELFVLHVEVAHLSPGPIQDAYLERFLPSDLEHRWPGSKCVSPRGNRQPARSAVRSSVSTAPFMLCAHIA
jgi:hypothetical protein